LLNFDRPPAERINWWEKIAEGPLKSRDELFQQMTVPEAYIPPSDQDGMVTLYRGVRAISLDDTPELRIAKQFARNGWAIPLGWGKPGASRNPYAHNSLSSGTFTIFTSWTTRESLAEKLAGSGGVVLKIRIRLPSPIQILGVFVQLSPDMFGENEVLLIGPQKANSWRITN
jgi:hypothetical protein